MTEVLAYFQLLVAASFDIRPLNSKSYLDSPMTGGWTVGGRPDLSSGYVCTLRNEVRTLSSHKFTDIEIWRQGGNVYNCGAHHPDLGQLSQ